jgi:hypothetical protein
MPTVTVTTDPKKPKPLTLTRVGDEVKIEVNYVAEFSKLEQHLVEYGLEFQEQIALMGVDPPSEPTDERELVRKELVGEELVEFKQAFPRSEITDRREVKRNLVVDSTQLTKLQEDPMVGDPDEICCRIRIAAIGLPSGVTPDVFTNEQVLFR